MIEPSSALHLPKTLTVDSEQSKDPTERASLAPAEIIRHNINDHNSGMESVSNQEIATVHGTKTFEHKKIARIGRKAERFKDRITKMLNLKRSRGEKQGQNQFLSAHQSGVFEKIGDQPPLSAPINTPDLYMLSEPDTALRFRVPRLNAGEDQIYAPYSAVPASISDINFQTQYSSHLRHSRPHRPSISSLFSRVHHPNSYKQNTSSSSFFTNRSNRGDDFSIANFRPADLDAMSVPDTPRNEQMHTSINSAANRCFPDKYPARCKYPS